MSPLLLVVFALFSLDILTEVAGDSNAVNLPSLDLQQFHHESIDHHADSTRVKRKIYQFEMHPHKKWTSPIKYIIDDSLDNVVVRGNRAAFLIRKVIREDFEEKTCLDFQEINRAPPSDEQYIVFSQGDSVSTCMASIGMASNTRTIHGQPVYLGRNCFALRRALVYTVASTLGLLNEMNRPDRDKYVDLNLDYVNSEDLFNFARHSSDYFNTLDLPYDFGSVMHHRLNRGLKAEVSNRSETALTMIPKERRLLYIPGQMSEISFYDSFAINQAYCNATCRARLNCQNGGYEDPTSCTKCRCPDGYGGTRCEQINEGSRGCKPSSGKLVVRNEIHCLQSPNFNTTLRRYASGDECAWQLTAPPGRLIDLWFNYLELPSSPMSVYAICLHWVEIKYKGLEQTRGARYCQDVNRARLKPGFIPEAVVPMTRDNLLTTETNEILVIFRSPDYFEPRDRVARGFELCYNISNELPPPPPNGPEVASQNDDGSRHRNAMILYIGAAVGVLLLILILSICICIVFMVTKKKKKARQGVDAGFQTSTSTVTISDAAIEEAIAKKKEQIEDSLEGTVNPAMTDTFQLPAYNEHDPPPKYDSDPWQKETSDGLENPLYENT